MSEYLAGKSVRKINEGIMVNRVDDINFDATDTLFNIVGGRVLVKAIFGVVTTQIGNVATNTHLSHDPDDGAAAVLTLAAGTDIDSLAVGVQLVATGAVGAALATSVNVVNYPAASFLLKPGTIDIVTAADPVDGAMSWHVIYVPIDDGAYIEAA